MEIRRGITELLEAIPDRIEVSGQAPTWRVTGGSFESVVDYANEAFDEPVVLAREDRSRWWPRVTLTVTTDPALAEAAPPLEELAQAPEADAPDDADAPKEPVVPAPRHRAEEDEIFESFLAEAFARQEAARDERAHVPQQRRLR
jgi:hypothetical protein